MKVIDLLNKIANGEIEENKEYLFYGSDYCTIREFFNRYIVDKENLNLKVEKLGEDKKMKRLKDINTDYYSKELYYENLSKEEITLDIQTLKHKVNEIIDKLNEMEKE